MAEHSVLPQAISLAVHEFRTPLTVLAGYLRMLLSEQAGPLTEKQRKMLEEANKSCGRVSTLVEEMSEFGKLEAGQLAFGQQRFDLSQLSAELASGMHEGSERGVRLEVRGANQPLPVTGDRSRIAAALRALMYASLRERGEPGVIFVERSRVAGTLEWGVVVIGDETVLPLMTRKAGEDAPGFDEWRKSGGLGMTIPVARRVIEAHGGALWSPDDDRPRRAAGLRLPLDIER